MATQEIEAAPGAFAKTLLMPGDPLRAKYIAENFLDDAKLITATRNMFGYTGYYKGCKVSVMGSGIGLSSIGFYSYELFSNYGVENIIRVGTTGSYVTHIDLMDLILCTSSVSDSAYARALNGYAGNTVLPSKELNEKISKKAEELNITLRRAAVHSTVSFFTHEPDEAVVKRLGAEVVEMESFALLHNANALGKRAAVLLTVSDNMATGQSVPADVRRQGFNSMITLALESALEF